MCYFGQVLMHHYKSMDGAWSFALGPYWRVNLTQYFLDPFTDILYDYEDMYSKIASQQYIIF